MKKILVANRGEIAVRVFRACIELGIGTVGVYAQEDEYSLHRFKADEAYLIGKGKKPIDAYLDIEDILRVAKEAEVDGIHPGYGLLSENIDFARRCIEEGFIFIGPTLEQLDMFGDKIKAKEVAIAAGVESIPGTDGPVEDVCEVLSFGESYGYPIMIKAVLGGGGRGMRIAKNAQEARDGYERAKSEAKSAFGSDEIYVEKYIANPKHIEVQILGDTHGNIIHLFERDCSVQRRNQKVVEVAPCVSITEEKRQKICVAALKLMKHVGYVNAGTVEFLFEGDHFYFIEVNPRIQVEHTITEMITGIDIVVSQILIADGCDLHQDLNIPKQEKLGFVGAAIQCRVTTEDPANYFLPDTGKINTYRSSGGFGVRLDIGNAYPGYEVTPFFDSLLVKVCTHALDFQGAVQKMRRCLKEFRIHGVKTNLFFLSNVVNAPEFQSGEVKTTFIDNTSSLFKIPIFHDSAYKMLKYIGNVTINGFPGIEQRKKRYFDTPRMPENLIVEENILTAKQILDTKGAESLASWVMNEPNILLTDTTFRDAHQSLLATRVRMNDFKQIAKQTGDALPNLFSSECWGGATFDVAYRFLSEDPWERLQMFRELMPNTLLQMLFRGSNAVGYQNYPDNVLVEFIKEAAHTGVDVFRIFDSLNWVPQMEKSIQAVRDTGKVAEAAICYTGDIMDPNRQKYSLKYYTDLAKELEAQGAHIIAIKDMAGLLKPQASYKLISALKETVDVPIHLHVHDTSGNGLITYSAAVKAGVDIVDVAIAALANGTSQPGMSPLYHALVDGVRVPDINMENVYQLNHYWEDVRKYYFPFENGLTSPQSEVYMHEMPGGQYSNLQQQAKALGLAHRWDDIKKMYQTVNLMFGDIIKVTPSSKVVGDMALFMIQNNLSEEDVYARGEELSFPKSVVSFFAGDLGQPVGGFPKKLQKIVLKGRVPLKDRPGLHISPVDFEKVKLELQKQVGYEPNFQEVLSYLMYPQVFVNYTEEVRRFGEINLLDTPTFFSGIRLGEVLEVQMQKGKVLRIHLDSIGEADIEGERVLFFNLNGQRLEIKIRDTGIQTLTVAKPKAEPTNREHVGATMSGSVVKVFVKKGERVKKGSPLLITEAMKMETTMEAMYDGIVDHVYVSEGEAIAAGDLLIDMKEKSFA
ncbi:MAG: pyruvate carboxylase [Lactobacillales bacterium]|nr:pyruvate carboxylase [Lactobacillales bacterium]